MSKTSVSPGKFISFEGGEGVGKSTQVHLLRDRLVNNGIDVLVTREPGGSPGAEEVRQLLLTGNPDKWDPMSEVLLFYAARVDHLTRTVQPALKAGKWVISDRYADSTFAYQGAGHGLGADLIQKIHHIATGNFWPDLTLLLDIAPENGLKRALAREAEISENQREDRFEKMDHGFHRDLRQTFLNRAKADPSRFNVISADGTIEGIAGHIWQAVQSHFSMIQG